MKDWTEQVAAAEAQAERLQAEEQAAEQRFYELRAAHGEGEALQSQEFQAWMQARHATDAAWGAWSQVMDARPQA